MIGALYALGLKQRQLMLHYTVLPVLICLSGGNPWLILYGIAVPSLDRFCRQSSDHPQAIDAKCADPAAQRTTAEKEQPDHAPRLQLF